MVAVRKVETDTFLTDSEVKDMTGYGIKSKQIEYLRNNGLPHFISASGNPRVPRAILHSSPKQKARTGPRLEGLSNGKKATK